MTKLIVTYKLKDRFNLEIPINPKTMALIGTRLEITIETRDLQGKVLKTKTLYKVNKERALA
jgi:hypothetical protein